MNRAARIHRAFTRRTHIFVPTALGGVAAATALVLAVSACSSRPAPTPRTEEPSRTPVAQSPTPVPKPTPHTAPTPTVPSVVEAPAALPSAALPTTTGLNEVFPGVRIDKAARIVEFDGFVPIEAHDPNAPLVFLEVVVCTPDTKEHESLVVTRARAQHVHAALLLLDIEPGEPGSWEMRGNPPSLAAVPPKGPPIGVELVYTDSSGRAITADARDWITDARTGRRFGEGDPDGGRWVFAGSRLVPFEGRNAYDADGVGTLVGLSTFGAETIAWHRVISPDSQVEEPEWVANAKLVPAVGTTVTVRLHAAPPDAAQP